MAFNYWSDSTRRNALPLVVAGPVLRKVTSSSVTVWIAFRGAVQTPVLKVYEPVTGYTVFSSDSGLATGAHAYVTHIGSELNIAVLEAKSIDSVSGPTPLSQSTIYNYDIEFPQGPNPSSSYTGGGLNTPDIMSPSAGADSILFPGQSLPSFCLPPADLDSLHLMYGSCRKPHGVGEDAFSAYYDMLELNFADPDKRPHQLFLIGDQIYADDVADSMLAMIQDITASFFSFSDLSLISTSPSVLTPGGRSSIVSQSLHFSVDPEAAKNHLLGLHEFYAMYLLSWSDKLWPPVSSWPTHSDSGSISEFDVYIREQIHLLKFWAALPKVMKVLANVPVYMLLDDHEITDDLFFSHEWTLNALSTTSGEFTPQRMVIFNGLCAYALFQDAGNDLSRYSSAFFSNLTEGTTDIITGRSVISGLIMPTYNSDDRVMERPSGSIPFYYNINFGSYEIVALDTRLMRSFPSQADNNNRKLPIVLPIGKEEYFAQQIPELTTDSTVKLTVLLLPDPLSGPEYFTIGKKIGIVLNRSCMSYIANKTPLSNEKLSSLAAQTPLDFEGNDAEDWEFALRNKRWLFERLKMRGIGTPNRLARVLILSGDVHFGYTNRIQVWGNLENSGGGTSSATYEIDDYKVVIAQLCASAQKNEGPSTLKGTYALHNGGYVPPRGAGILMKEKRFRNAGGNNLEILPLPCFIFDLNFQPLNSHKLHSDYPDESGNHLTSTFNIDPSISFLHIDRYNANYLPHTFKDSGPSGYTVVPKITYRVDFLRDESPLIRLNDTPTLIPSITSNDRDTALNEYLNAANDVDKYNQEWGAGKEIVGYSCVGEVTFNWPSDNGENTEIIHDLWWCVLQRPNANIIAHPFNALTRHNVSMGFENSTYNKP